MNPRNERRYLAAVAAAENRPLHSTPRRRVVRGIAWLVLAVALYFVFQFSGTPKAREWLWVAAAFVVGAFAGALGVYDAARKQWPVIQRYIDFERVKARLSEIDG